MYAPPDVLRRFGALFIVEDAKHFSTAASVASNPLAEKTAPKAVFFCACDLVPRIPPARARSADNDPLHAEHLTHGQPNPGDHLISPTA